MAEDFRQAARRQVPLILVVSTGSGNAADWRKDRQDVLFLGSGVIKKLKKEICDEESDEK